jgi:hypothetical protein
MAVGKRCALAVKPARFSERNIGQCQGDARLPIRIAGLAPRQKVRSILLV